ncbi:MAG: hypothetical protein MUC40_10580, partial [Akkermansiaceae bacterium]|nr:hypothetical protein [Akkermansiaceae bacterium]
LVSLREWSYEKQAGLGGSGAWALLNGRDGVDSEIDLGVGWQDPAVIRETGLCVWRSGPKPMLDFKHNGDFLSGRMAIYWTGTQHDTPGVANHPRDYDRIAARRRHGTAAGHPRLHRTQVLRRRLRRLRALSVRGTRGPRGGDGRHEGTPPRRTLLPGVNCSGGL